MSERVRILFVLHNVGHGGSERLVHRIIHGLGPSRLDFAVVGLASDGATADAMRREGVRLHALGHTGGMNLGLALKLRKLIRQERPDLINTHHLAPLLYARLASWSLVRRPPLIHTVHVLPEVHREHGSMSRKAVALYHLLLKQANHVVCVSQAERERLRKVPGLPPSGVTAVPNGIDIGAYRPMPPSAELRSELGIPAGVSIITNVGAFRAQKNQTGLVEAFRRIVARRQDVVLLLVGGPVADGSALRDAEQAVASHGLANHVRFLGARPDVPQILALTDIYVQPSLYEGLPLSVLEAMAMQRAVVATDVGGNNELVRDGRTGLLVPPGDPQAICDAVLRLLDNPSLRASLGLAARDLVSKGYSESCMIDRYEMLYRILVHRTVRCHS